MLDSIRKSFTPTNSRAEAILDEACRIIEEVHGVKGVATYQFDYDELPFGVHGQHMQGFDVVVSSITQNPILAAIHEIGHAIDAVFLNSAQGYGSPDEPFISYGSDIAGLDPGSLLGDWIAAIRASQYWQRLSDALKQPEIDPRQAEEILALMKPRECWARSYELYIATRKPTTNVAEQMNVERSLSLVIGDVTVYNYWQGNDFDKVEVCINRIFERIGWLI